MSEDIEPQRNEERLRANARRRLYKCLPSIACLVLLALVSPECREVMLESATTMWVWLGGSCAFLLGAAVTVVRHQDEGRKWSDSWSIAVRYLKSMEFLTPLFATYCIFLVVFVVGIPLKFHEMRGLLEKERSLNVSRAAKPRDDLVLAVQKLAGPSLPELRARAKPTIEGLRSLGEKFLHSAIGLATNNSSDHDELQKAWDHLYGRFFDEYQAEFAYRVDVIIDRLGDMHIDTEPLRANRPGLSRYGFADFANMLERTLQEAK